MVDRESLISNYSSKSDDELLDLYISGTLTELAYEVLAEELAKRSVKIPERPPKKDEQLAMSQELLVKYYSKKSDQEMKEILVSGKLDKTAQIIVQAEFESRFPEEKKPFWLKIFFWFRHFFH